MLSTMRSSWLLFALLCLVALSTAFSVDDLRIDGINAYLHHGERRQAQGTGASSSAPAPSTSDSPSPTPDEPSSTPDSSPTPTPDPSPSERSSSAAPSDNNSPAPSTDAASPSTQTSRGAAASSTQTPTPTNNNNSPSKTSAQRTSYTTKALVSTELIPTTTVYETVIDGSTRQVTSAGSRTVQHTTGSVVETSISSTDTSSDSSGGGLSSEKKAIIGGVVGGVGGAILLCGLAIVAWRRWHKKKRVTEDDADLMAGTGAALGDKTSQGQSPFQSNLEQYHGPGGRPNAAANF